MGNFNAVVGEGHDEKVIGKFGLGRRNDRGQMLVDFCKKKKLVATNTWDFSKKIEDGIHGRVLEIKKDIR